MSKKRDAKINKIKKVVSIFIIFLLIVGVMLPAIFVIIEMFV